MPSSHAQNLFNAFNALSNSDLIALRKAASIHIRGTNLYADPNDLIHEALLRCLENRRHWNGQVPFTVFLSNVMRSIAYADRNSFESCRFISASAFEEGGMPDGLGWIAPRSPSAEEDNIELQRAALGQAHMKKLKAYFAEDWLVLELVNAWATGDRSPQIMERHGIQFATFEAARRRLQRHIQTISQTYGGEL